MSTLRTLEIAAVATTLVLGAAFPARADEPAADPLSPPDRTLFSGHVRHGGYGAPEVKMSTFTGDAAVFVGAQGGWVIDRHVIVGIAGYGLATRHTPDLALQNRAAGTSRIELGYGGPRVGYVIEPTHLVHVAVFVLVGAGGLTIGTYDRANGSSVDTHDSTAFPALEPQAEMELNVTKFMRFAIGGSYRYLGDTVKPGLRASDMSGPAGSIALKFGSF